MERQYGKIGSWLVAALLWFSCVFGSNGSHTPMRQ